MFSFPGDCITPSQRTEYAYRCQELLRLLHNAMGTWGRDGLTLTQWNKFPAKIQTRYPYQLKLPIEQWNDFRSNIFESTSNNIAEAIVTQRDLLKASTKWSIITEDLV